MNMEIIGKICSPLLSGNSLLIIEYISQDDKHSVMVRVFVCYSEIAGHM